MAIRDDGGEIYEKYDNLKALKKAIKEMGFKEHDIEGMGMSLDDLVGKWFAIIHNRLFIKNEDEFDNEE